MLPNLAVRGVSKVLQLSFQVLLLEIGSSTLKIKGFTSTKAIICSPK